LKVPRTAALSAVIVGAVLALAGCGTDQASAACSQVASNDNMKNCASLWHQAVKGCDVDKKQNDIPAGTNCNQYATEFIQGR
jgi:hypothetical protein